MSSLLEDPSPYLTASDFLLRNQFHGGSDSVHVFLVFALVEPAATTVT